MLEGLSGAGLLSRFAECSRTIGKLIKAAHDV
jgi:hypothetical protein